MPANRSSKTPSRAALVVIWLLVLALHLARPYMLTNLRKFTLRLGADLWWIVYVSLRDILLAQVFLGSFIFFYPDVVSGKDLPITGSVAAVCAFAALLLKLTSKGEGDMRSFRWQSWLLAAGALLYIGPYMLGVQLTAINNAFAKQVASILGHVAERWLGPLAQLPVRPGGRRHGPDRRRLQPTPDDHFPVEVVGHVERGIDRCLLTTSPPPSPRVAPAGSTCRSPPCCPSCGPSP